MKKIFIAVIVILAGVMLIAPKLIGSTVEEERKQILSELNKADGISITTKEYIGSWFGAKVSSELTVNLEEEGLADLVLTLDEDLTFGPIVMTKQGWFLALGYSQLRFSVASADVDSDILTLINEKIHLGALLDFNSNVTTFINTDKFNYEGQGSSLSSEPLAAKFALIDNKKIKGDFSWGGIELNELGKRFVIGKVDMSTEQQVVSGDYLKGTAILSGDAKFNVEKINMYSQDNHIFSLNDTEIASSVSVNNDLLALNLKYHAKDISASGQFYEKPSMEIEFANVDIKALQELNTLMANLSNDQVNNTNSDEILKVLSGVVEQMLAKEPTLKVTDLSVVAEEGKVNTALNLAINKDLIDTNNLNSMSFVMALEGDAKGKAPLGLLAKFGLSPMVDAFVQQGYLTKQENDIHFTATYIQNALTLNGKSFQL